MIISVSTLTYTDVEKALELRKSVIHPVVKGAPGCLFCQVAESTAKDGEYLILIGWESEEACRAFNSSWAHDILKDNQWPLMERKILTKEYELLFD